MHARVRAYTRVHTTLLLSLAFCTSVPSFPLAAPSPADNGSAPLSPCFTAAQAVLSANEVASYKESHSKVGRYVTNSQCSVTQRSGEGKHG